MSSFDYRDDQLAMAEVLAIKERAVRACERHEDVLINNGDPTARERALRRGTEAWDRNDVPGPREDFLRAVAWKIDQAVGRCPRCP